MSTRFPLGRIIATSVAVCFLGVACVGFFLSYVTRAYFWHPARFNCLATLSVDFSAPGTYAATFDYGPTAMHDVSLGLDVPKTVLSKTPLNVLLSGLQGTFSILDEDGTEIVRGSLVGDSNGIRVRHFQNIVELCSLRDWYGKANWQINVTVTRGAPRLKGIRQRLVLFDGEAAFRLRTTRLFQAFVACTALLLAAIILIVVALKFFRKRKQQGNSH
ncbi:MAG: hypothetical protein JSW66_18785 [Phycisphaerales bacterium]|nr:MAG: hypothetical protein JSW66_18785 [Phycisphaerales bacterium]